MPLDRRHLILGTLALAATPARAAAPQSAVTAHAFAFQRPGGGRFALGDFAGKPILIVNTATACGYAGQMATLEQLWQRYKGRGLALIAVPSNDFGGQEPLDGAAIAEAARQSHGATYPFAEKTVVRGPAAHPFYRWAAARMPGAVPSWNFHKYLIGRDGALLGGWSAGTQPLDPGLIRAIGQELDAV